MKTPGQERYIIERIAIGTSVKVTAFDPKTLTEVSVIGSIKTPIADLNKLAVRKLEYMMAKQEKP